MEDLARTVDYTVDDACEIWAEYLFQRRTILQVVKNLRDSGGSRLVKQANHYDKTAAHELSYYFPHKEEEHCFRLQNVFLREQTKLAVELLHLFDDYGQHWDYCYNH